MFPSCRNSFGYFRPSLPNSDDVDAILYPAIWIHKMTGEEVSECVYFRKMGFIFSTITYLLRHWGRKYGSAIFRTIFSNWFSCVKIVVFGFKFHWTLTQQWFRQYLVPVKTYYYLNQRGPCLLMRISGSISDVVLLYNFMSYQLLPKPMSIYFQLFLEIIVNEIRIKISDFLYKKFIWKCHLQNGQYVHNNIIIIELVMLIESL